MITEEIIKETLRIRAESPRTTFRQIAEQLLGNGDYAAALRKYITDQQRGSEVAVITKERRKILDSINAKPKRTVARLPGQYIMELSKAAHVDTDSALIISDLHCPHVDRAMIEAAVRDAKENKVNTIIIAGDILDGQFTGRHKNPPQYVAPAEVELQYMRNYLKYFEGVFENVYVCPGNHDEWVTNFFEVTFKELVDKVMGEHKIVVSEFEYITVNKNLVAGHLEEWNEVPGFLAWKIAKQFNKHAIVGHDHIRGVYSETNLNLVGISMGASLLPSNIYYKNASFNSFPAFQNGYAILESKNSLRLMEWTGKKARVDTIIHLPETT
jgi:predicted phosphodiesterase